jgi:two-component system chemotaxis response regulator CheY
MLELDDELGQDFLAECREHLASIEADLLAIEQAGAKIDTERVNRVFRAVHSIKGGAASFDLPKIRELAHRTEDALALVRNGKMIPTPHRVGVLLQATDQLHEMIQNPAESNQADIAQITAELAGLRADKKESREGRASPSGQPGGTQGGGRLRALLVEDDIASRLVLQTFLSRYGECYVAVSGREAVNAFRSAYRLGQRYDLLCIDIMLPEMDGREVVRQVRAIEDAHGILSTRGVKVIMTTAVEDVKEVFRCFRELCDAYLIKPIDLAKLLIYLKSYRLVQ